MSEIADSTYTLCEYLVILEVLRRKLAVVYPFTLSLCL